MIGSLIAAAMALGGEVCAVGPGDQYLWPKIEIIFGQIVLDQLFTLSTDEEGAVGLMPNIGVAKFGLILDRDQYDRGDSSRLICGSSPRNDVHRKMAPKRENVRFLRHENLTVYPPFGGPLLPPTVDDLLVRLRPEQELKVQLAVFRDRRAEVAGHNVQLNAESPVAASCDFRCDAYRYPRTRLNARYILGVDEPPFRRVGSSLGFNEGSPGVPSGEGRSQKGEAAYDRCDQPQPESPPGPNGGFFRSIRSLPLGAKIGITGVLASLASSIWLFGFVRLLERKSNLTEGLGYGLAGIILIAASGLFWW